MKSSLMNVGTWKREQVVRFTLSLPVQVALFSSLGALTIWTVYFSSYPAVHNRVHELRHNTLMVGCH